MTRRSPAAAWCRLLALFALFFAFLAPRVASAEEEKQPDPKAQGAKKDDKKGKAAEAEENDPDDHTPQTFHVGIHIQRLSKLELGPGTFEADFLVGYRCDKEPCKPRPALSNGDIKGKPELLVDEPLHKIYRIKAELTANIDLGDFPFDSHELVVELMDHDGLDVTFVPDTKEMAGKSDIALPGWEITGTDAKVTSEDLGGGLKDQNFEMTIHVHRPRLAVLAKNFLPAFVMVLVLFVSLFMKPKMAPARLAAGTGSFVAVIMFHNTAANQLPPLGFLTLLDKFMFSLYLLWVIHITLSVLILRAEDAKNEAMGAKIYKSAFAVLPVVGILSWVLVFLRVL